MELLKWVIGIYALGVLVTGLILSSFMEKSTQLARVAWFSAMWPWTYYYLVTEGITPHELIHG